MYTFAGSLGEDGASCGPAFSVRAERFSDGPLAMPSGQLAFCRSTLGPSEHAEHFPAFGPKFPQDSDGPLIAAWTGSVAGFWAEAGQPGCPSRVRRSRQPSGFLGPSCLPTHHLQPRHVFAAFPTVSCVFYFKTICVCFHTEGFLIVFWVSGSFIVFHHSSDFLNNVNCF